MLGRIAWAAVVVGVLGALSGCAEDEPILTDQIPCNADSPCPLGYSCLVDQCVENESLAEGLTCTRSIQCMSGLICRDFTCQPGCGDIYHLDVCTDQTWCKPLADTVMITDLGTVPAGECSPSECDPRVAEFCEPGIACVTIASDVGACLPYCEYGFVANNYTDSCTDTAEFDLACQPLGLTGVPVCLPAGGLQSPSAGVPGCDTILEPCRPGSVCVDVVCRQLCTQGQLDPCFVGEICAAVGQRTDIGYCVAD